MSYLASTMSTRNRNSNRNRRGNNTGNQPGRNNPRHSNQDGRTTTRNTNNSRAAALSADTPAWDDPRGTLTIVAIPPTTPGTPLVPRVLPTVDHGDPPEVPPQVPPGTTPVISQPAPPIMPPVMPPPDPPGTPPPGKYSATVDDALIHFQ